MNSPVYPPLPDAEPLSRSDLLALEKEVMGIYLSDHPLRGMDRLIEGSSSHTCSIIEELEEGTPVKLAGVIAGLRTMITKRTGEKMANFTLEDFSGQAGVIVFASTYAKFKELVTKDRVVRVSGVVMHRERPGNGGEKSIEVRMEEISPLEPSLDIPLSSDKVAVLRMIKATQSQMELLRTVLKKHPGEYEVRVDIKGSGSIHVPVTIDPTSAFIEEARSAVPRLNVEVRGNGFGLGTMAGVRHENTPSDVHLS
jgi:DNA polymerase-3 subunit alpha